MNSRRDVAMILGAIAYLAAGPVRSQEAEVVTGESDPCNEYDYCVFDGFVRISAGGTYHFVVVETDYSGGGGSSQEDTYGGLGGRVGLTVAHIFGSGVGLGGFAAFDFAPGLEIRGSSDDESLTNLYLLAGPQLSYHPVTALGLFILARAGAGWARNETEFTTDDRFSWGGGIAIGYETAVSRDFHLGASLAFSILWFKDGEDGDHGSYEYNYVSFVPSIMLHALF